MDRRTVLGLVGGVTSGVAGCLATGTGDRAPGTTATTAPATPSGSPPVNEGGLDEFDPADTYTEVDVGSRVGVDEAFRPYDLDVWNAPPDRRVVGLRILDRLADEPVYRTTDTVPADEALAVTLSEPSRYFVQLWGPAVAAETMLVPCAMFDCNSSVTAVAVLESGRVRSSVSSTLKGCPSPDC